MNRGKESGKFRRAGIGCAVLSAALLVGCAGAPVQEMSDARQAIKAAAEAGIDSESQAELDQAMELLSHAEIKLQERDYRSARRAAVEAQRLAVVALSASRD